MPLPTIRRYPIFLRVIGEMMDVGEAYISSSVIDVAPGGRTYRLMLVDARDERGTVLGAYDFTTAKKESL